LTSSASYIEGVVRGYRNALLTSQNYSNLTQCENIDGMPAPIPPPLTRP
jgi:V-type H+-transporting ATPase subunit d